MFTRFGNFVEPTSKKLLPTHSGDKTKKTYRY